MCDLRLQQWYWHEGDGGRGHSLRTWPFHFGSAVLEQIFKLPNRYLPIHTKYHPIRPHRTKLARISPDRGRLVRFQVLPSIFIFSGIIFFDLHLLFLLFDLVFLFSHLCVAVLFLLFFIFSDVLWQLWSIFFFYFLFSLLSLTPLCYEIYIVWHYLMAEIKKEKV